ncbi:hypothetical protein [Ruegeria sp.]|uniref:hypothetical protein n=1 Tax=Ruegeria sp. TaxID=1879320 RepID=UPI003B5A9D72
MQTSELAQYESLPRFSRSKPAIHRLAKTLQSQPALRTFVSANWNRLIEVSQAFISAQQSLFTGQRKTEINLTITWKNVWISLHKVSEVGLDAPFNLVFFNSFVLGEPCQNLCHFTGGNW